MQSLETCKANLAARLITLTNDLIRTPNSQAANSEFHSILGFMDRITKTQLQQQQLSPQSEKEAQHPCSDVEETQAWMKSLGVWMASLEERLNEHEVQLQKLQRLIVEQ